jgi:DNA-binding MarR family transcriptional regulator
MRNPSSINKDYALWVLLGQAKDMVFKAREKELRQYGISPEEAAVLFIVQCLGNQATPTEISRWLLRKPHTVSGILSRMEKKGLVTKTKGPPRKNLVRVTLTDKGEQAYYQSTKIESIRQIMSSLSEQERQQLSSRLKTLRDRALKELGIDTKPPFPKCQ